MDNEQKTGSRRLKTAGRIILYLVAIAFSLFLLQYLYYACREVYFPNRKPYDEKAASLEEQKLYKEYRAKAEHVDMYQPPLLFRMMDKFEDLFKRKKQPEASVPTEMKPRRNYGSQCVVYTPPNINWKIERDKFIHKTGFRGEFSGNKSEHNVSNEKYTFTTMIGTFNLPEPKDSLTLIKNTDYIVANILAMYGKAQSGFKLGKPTIHSYDHITPFSRRNDDIGIGYPQFFPIGFNNKSWDSGNYYNLSIRYDFKTKVYTVRNNLFEMPLSLPSIQINKQTAIRLAQAKLLESPHLSKADRDSLIIGARLFTVIKCPKTAHDYYYYLESYWRVSFIGDGKWVKKQRKVRSYRYEFFEEYFINAFTGKNTSPDDIHFY